MKAWISAWIVTVILCLSAVLHAADRPNILIILTDDGATNRVENAGTALFSVMCCKAGCPNVTKLPRPYLGFLAILCSRTTSFSPLSVGHR